MERLDDLMLSGLKILQDTDRFCFGMDAVLLSGFVRCPKGGRLLDLGTGTGILPILLSAKTEASYLAGLEIQPESASMARRSVELNGLFSRVEILEGDIREVERLFKPASFDVVCSNPPYMAAGRGLTNPGEPRAIARHEILCDLKDVIRAAAHVLPEGGHFYMVHRPERLSDIFCSLRELNMEAKGLRMVYPRAEREANMVLVEAVKGGRPGLRVQPPMILQEADGSYTEEIRRDYGF